MEEQGRFEELDAQGQERKESAWASDLTRCDREQQRWAESEAIAEQCAALHLMDLDEAWRGEGEKEGGHCKRTVVHRCALFTLSGTHTLGHLRLPI